MRSIISSSGKRTTDILVFITIIFSLLFTSLTVSSSFIDNDQMQMNILSYDSSIHAKEIQRTAATLVDDVCDDCDDDDDDDPSLNKQPTAVIYTIEPNPGHEYENIFFEGYGEDSDGTIIGYKWELNEGNTLSSEASFSSSTVPSGSHLVTFYVEDNDHAWSEPVSTTLVINENQAPLSPVIAGKVQGKAGETFEYKVITSDPEGHDVYYFVEWGDTTVEDWDGPYASNEEASFIHSWQQTGSYTIRAKAKDQHGSESEWGTLQIQMPRSPLLMRTFIYQLLNHIFRDYPLINTLIS